MTTFTFKAGVLVLCAVAGSSAFAQAYTFKVGGAYIDPRATSSDIQGSMPVNVGSTYYGNVTAVSGAQLEVQAKSTLVFSIERAFDTHWSAEVMLGYPPKHDVKLRASSPVVSPEPLASSLGASSGAAAAAGVVQHVASFDGQVVAKVQNWAPTAFLNYTFGEASQKFRPFVGAGLNYTHLKAESTDAGNALYMDGKVRISTSDSLGLAFHMGANYRLDKHWLLNASWATAGVKSTITIRTDHSEQNASYRFHPSVFSVMVGYQF